MELATVLQAEQLEWYPSGSGDAILIGVKGRDAQSAIVATVYTVEHAMRICRSYNAHEPMLLALKKAHGRLGATGCNQANPALMERIRAAISKAEAAVARTAA